MTYIPLKNNHLQISKICIGWKSLSLDVHEWCCFIFKIKRYKNPSILMTLFMGWFFGDSAVAPPSWPESESESCSAVSDSLWPRGLYSPWNSPGQNSGVGSIPLSRGIFPTQGLNPGLLHCRWVLYQLNHQGKLFTDLQKHQYNFCQIKFFLFRFI